ncbi:MAG TPA: glycoside hydrolase family 3 C-terminal domain-containing protein [Candidatus Acidoferrum sp.]|nr:glycoside hydrolase family 3 C-terminal domain-containing protein [Candidatus Acidoferrum sp.]
MKTLRRLLCLIVIPLATFAQNTPPAPAYLDPSLPIDQRVNDLVSRLTLEEKISQMQDVAPAIPRLNIPAYNWWNEGLHGVARAGIATVFPQAIGLAATWDSNLLHRVADVISTEARAKYNDAILHNNTGRYYGLTFWSPNINIFRDPRWGRGQETYGEDPFLTARLGVAFVTGLQGDDPHYLKTVSTPKHYAVHSGPETLRHRFNINVSLQDLYDTYTPAFRATVTEGHAGSVMCAYNSVRGEPACANQLLFDLLRNQWGFRGYVVSDCWAISDLYQGHNFVLSLYQSAALSVKAGTDLSCGPEFSVLDQSVRDRMLAAEDIDRAVKRLFEARFRLGMFDPPANVPWSKLSLSDIDTSANRQLALTTARESIVLLKNDRNMLPLKSSVKSIAVVGPNADSLDVLLGNYNGTPSHYTTILAGIRKRFSNAKINYAVGAPLTESRALAVPGTVLRTGGASSEPGLTAEYFTNSSLSGSPLVTRIDPALDFVWNNISPAPGIPTENYSVRWSGELVAPADGDYRIGASSDGGFRLFFDGKVLIDDWVTYGQRGERTFTTLVRLQAGHAYPIKLEYFRRFRESFARLLWVPPNLTQEAVDAARKSDVVIAVVGITADLEGEERDNSDPGFFGGDRTDIYLPRTQEELLQALAATGKPLVVVLTAGSALAVNWANEHAAAILQAWYPGEEGGTAVADVLSGDYNPAGRLPITFYKSIAQLPPFTDYSMRNRTYRYFTEDPLFPFGFGLSYSSFSYSDFAVTDLEPTGTGATSPAAEKPNSGAKQSSRSEISGTAPVHVSARLANTSSIPGDEVVELYISHPGAEGAPRCALVGFERVHLPAGGFQVVSFVLSPRELSIVDPNGNRLVPGGPVELWLGSGQPAAPLTKPTRPAPNGVALKFTVTASTPLPH